MASDERSPPATHPIAVAGGRVNDQWLGMFGWLTRRARGLVVFGTLDPVSLSAGARVAYTVTVTGARPGQRAEATFTAITADIVLFAAVSAADTVTVTFFNATGAGAVDLGSGTLHVRVGDIT